MEKWSRSLCLRNKVVDVNLTFHVEWQKLQISTAGIEKRWQRKQYRRCKSWTLRSFSFKKSIREQLCSWKNSNAVYDTKLRNSLPESSLDSTKQGSLHLFLSRRVSETTQGLMSPVRRSGWCRLGHWHRPPAAQWWFLEASEQHLAEVAASEPPGLLIGYSYSFMWCLWWHKCFAYV